MNYNYCQGCGKLLKGKIKNRKKLSTCYSCLDIANKNWELSRVCKEGLNPKSDESDGGNVFEDDPRAVNEIEYGKVIKQSVGYVFSESTLSELIIDTKNNKKS